MKKAFIAAQTGKNTWEKKTRYLLSRADIAGCAVFAFVLGWVIFQVVRAC